MENPNNVFQIWKLSLVTIVAAVLLVDLHVGTSSATIWTCTAPAEY